MISHVHPDLEWGVEQLVGLAREGHGGWGVDDRHGHGNWFAGGNWGVVFAHATAAAPVHGSVRALLGVVPIEVGGGSQYSVKLRYSGTDWAVASLVQ